MFLGFLKHGNSNRSHSTTLVLSVSIISTIVVMFLMFDSFFLQLPQTRSFISPLQNQDVQNCVMSYSYPTFYEVKSPESQFSKKYKLYLYREGNIDSPDHLYGSPVLFIPGQAGSHKQIRSLASATTQFSHEHQLPTNMDFFTVDLNEELSALNGQTLLDQSEYMNSAIKRILSLYDHPTSVIIIGHSMGGVVARTMFMLPNYIPNSIETIITLATPHITAPLLLDPVIFTVYTQMTDYWKSNRDILRNVTIISIAGGSLDNIIHSDGVQIESVIPSTHGFTTYTTSIPGVWTGADHMAILWCNQLIRLLAETLHGYLNLGTYPTVNERMKLFRFYLLEGKDSSIIKDTLHSIRFNQNRFIDLDRHRSYNVYLDEADKQEIIFISSTPNLQFLTNVDPKYDSCWLIVSCSKINGYDIQFSCNSIHPNVSVLPSASASNLVGSLPYRLLNINSVNKEESYASGFRDESHVRYIGLAQHCQIKTNNGDRPFIQASMISGQPVHHSVSVKDIILNGYSFKVNPYHSYHVFPAIFNSLFTFDFRIVSIEGNQHAQFKPMLEQQVNNKAIKYFRGLKTGVSNRLTVHQETQQQGLSLKIFTDNQALEIQIKFDWYGTLGRCVLRYGAIIASYFWISTLLVLLTQFYTYVMSGKREFPTYPLAFTGCVMKGPFLQLAAILLATTAIQYASSSYSFLKYALFGSNDWLMAGLLMLVLGISIGLTAIAWILVTIFASAVGSCLSALRSRNSPNYSLDREVAKSRFMVYSACTLGLIRVVPASALFVFYFTVWFLLTSSAYTKSDLPTAQNVYRYRQTILVFLLSFLPYHIPPLIVYVKDVLIGWTYQPSYSLVMVVQDMPIVFILIYLITFGKNPDMIELKMTKYLIFVMNGVILYQLIFGFLHPFMIITLLFSK